MSKLLIVESPTKARTIGKMLGKDYTIIASMGHIPRPAGARARGRYRTQLRAAVRRHLAQQIGREGAARRRQNRGRNLSRPRPRPRRGSDCMAPGRSARKEHEIPALPRDLPRDHPERHREGDDRKGRDQPESRRRAAGAPGPRPHRRLPSQPATLVADRKRFERRARPVGRTAARSRARTGDQRLPARGILGVCAGLPDCGRPGNSRRGSSRSTARISK